jgi:hypothetical protein
MDPDSEQLNEEVVEYQDTGDFMDPDSEQLNEEVYFFGYSTWAETVARLREV